MKVRAIMGRGPRAAALLPVLLLVVPLCVGCDEAESRQVEASGRQAAKQSASDVATGADRTETPPPHLDRDRGARIRSQGQLRLPRQLHRHPSERG